MTEEELREIEENACAGYPVPQSMKRACEDVLALITEVRRLREELIEESERADR